MLPGSALIFKKIFFTFYELFSLFYYTRNCFLINSSFAYGRDYDSAYMTVRRQKRSALSFVCLTLNTSLSFGPSSSSLDARSQVEFIAL